MTNARRIGKAAELEAAGKLNLLFGTGFRRSQQFKGHTDAPDLVCDQLDDVCPEVKRRADYSVKLHRAVSQARNEAGPNKHAFVVHRRPGERWLLTVDLNDAPALFVRMVINMADALYSHHVGKWLNFAMETALKNRAQSEREGINGKRKRKAATDV